MRKYNVFFNCLLTLTVYQKSSSNLMGLLNSTMLDHFNNSNTYTSNYILDFLNESRSIMPIIIIISLIFEVIKTKYDFSPQILY